MPNCCDAGTNIRRKECGVRSKVAARSRPALPIKRRSKSPYDKAKKQYRRQIPAAERRKVLSHGSKRQEKPSREASKKMNTKEAKAADDQPETLLQLAVTEGLLVM